MTSLRRARAQDLDTHTLYRLLKLSDHPCRINAPKYLADMYAQHGFVRDGEDFVDQGLTRMPMLRTGSGLAGLP